MIKISASLLDIESINDTYCKMFFDIDEIIGQDEVSGLIITKRIIAEFLGLSMEEFEKLLCNENKKEILKKSPRKLELKTWHGFNSKIEYSFKS